MNIQMTELIARLKRLAGLLALATLTAAIGLLCLGSNLRSATEAAQLGGPTEVNGIIDTDTTWTLANSPYIVTGNILVSQGVTLTIEPGVEIRFDGYYYLRVDGTLIADGTPEDLIVFTSNKTNPAPGDWNTIRFANTSTPAVYDENGNYIGGSIMRYCRIEYAYAGTYIESSPLISHSIFTQNGTLSWKESYPGGAIVISGSPIIADNVMTDNQGEGGAIRAFSGQPVIERNVIEGNQGSLAGAIVFTAAGGRISGNRILRNSGGYYGGDQVGGIFVNYSSVLIEKNLIAANSGVAIFMQMQTSVLDNTMTKSSGEAVIHPYSQVDSPPPIHGNNIYDNTATYDISVKDVPGRIGVSAENNWWGTMDTGVIDERIYDFYDDFNLGEVTYTPILTAPSTSAPSLLSNLSLDPPSPVLPQPVNMILDFSVGMNTAVSPTVTFGLTSPYTQYQVTSGAWISPTRWVGNYDLTHIPDGRYTVWVSDAVSAEDGIRVEDTRFGFVVRPLLNWTLINTDTEPSPRTDMALAYDSKRGKTVMFGGLDRYGIYLDETWEYDGTDWVQVETANTPPARIFHGLAYDSNRGRVVLFGGRDATGTWLDNTWEYDGADWVQVNTANTPGGRSAWGMTYDSGRGRVVLFGGSANLNDTWEYDGMNWVRVETATKPSSRSMPRLVYDSSQGKIVLFGGRHEAGTLLDDTWEYDGTDWVEVTTASKPPARYKHAMAYDSQRGRVVLFGGWDGSNRLDDTWEYDGTNWVEVSTSINPPAKTEHAMTYDSGRGKVVLFGGATNTGSSNDTWEYPCLFGDFDCDCDVDVMDIMEVASRWRTLPARNFSPNPSFENGTAFPDGWRPPLGGADYGWDEAVAHTGMRSISISNVQEHRSVEWETTDLIAINPDLAYEASVWVKGTSGLDAYLTVWQYDANGNSTGPGMGLLLPYVSSVWTQSTAPVRIHPGTSKVRLTLGLNNPGPNDTGTVWFDDVSFTGASDPMYDVDDDGDIDIVDIMKVVTHWGDTCPP